ncbi:DgyrCDS13919 [Dimorphilus gyrociliatus]|uniref:Beta-mannosidase n=1 Tax=Dimorphilus gyrociliatus TaxID=2664684 RepID=A0A7I8WC31_9ANNE|nr:DgyrCDS13919 [Dimorphilus gyrociliatus]
MKFFIIFLVILEINSEKYIPLDGLWSLRSNSKNLTNIPATVPGNVYTDLRAHGILKKPLYYRDNDQKYRWVSRVDDWTYTRNFTVSQDDIKHGKIELVFEGLDTIAQIYINKIMIYEATNMFRLYSFNIKSLLKASLNSITVKFSSPIKYSAAKASQYKKRFSYDVPPKCPPTVQNGECNFNFIRKRASSFSWDWGPAFPGVGIWKSVYLRLYSSATLTQIVAYPVKDAKLGWFVKGSLYFNVVLAQKGKLTLSIANVIKVSNDVVLFADEHKYDFSMHVIRPIKLWWPNGYGKQNLYNLTIKFTTSDESTEKTVEIGFRTIELIRNPIGNDKKGDYFYFKINNLPIYIKGSNWIPADSFPNEISVAKLELLLKSAKLTGMNALRVWGGGIYESDKFYQLTNQYGIMIWQDLMFACSMYPKDEEFLVNVAREIDYQVLRLSNHPSITVWSFNNENEAALRENWYNTSNNYRQYYEDYIKLYIKTIKGIVEKDSTRPSTPSSPSNGLLTEKQNWVANNPQDPLYGDVHYYNYIGDSWNWTIYPIPRFLSEFGLQSWPSSYTMNTAFDKSDWFINSSVASNRQHHPNGTKELNAQIQSHFKDLPKSKDPKKYFEDFMFLTQINQAEGIRTEAELMRRMQNFFNSKGQGHTMGTLYWQLNDIWQAPTWSSIDYLGKWKMLQYFARRFYSNPTLSSYIDNDVIKLHFLQDILPNNDTNDNNLRFRSLLNLEPGNYVKKSLLVLKVIVFKWSSLNPIASQKFNIQRPIYSSAEIYQQNIRQLLQMANASKSELFLVFEATSDNIILYNWIPLAYYKDINLPKPKIQIKDLTKKTATKFTIELSTDNIAAYVWLEVYECQGYFSENGFLMYRREYQVEFYSWKECNNLNDITVKTLNHLYN